MINLRPYQSVMVDGIRAALRDHQSVIGVAPCGAGKTVMFSYIASRAREKGKRIGIFAHRSELLDQISRTLRMFNVPHALITAGSSIDMRHTVFVCSAQTYARRIPQVPRFDLIVVDEAHHCTTGSTWAKCLEHSPQAKVIGVSATPERLDGRGLGEMFKTMVEGPTMRELIEGGSLTKYRYFEPNRIDTSQIHTLGGDFKRDEAEAAVDKPSITGNAVVQYRKHLNGYPTVSFCTSVKHAEHVAEDFRSNGFTSASIDGRMDKVTRKGIIDDFSAGKINVLTSADLISEGFDVPGIHGCILLRPTKSLSIYIQQVGRAVRLCAGKDRAIILDHVGNRERHGLPDDDREWSLNGRCRPKMATAPETSWECPQCYQRNSIRTMKCDGCQFVKEARPREIEERDGELFEIDLEAARSETRIIKKKSPEMQAQARTRSLEGLVDLYLRQYADKGMNINDPDVVAKAERRAGYVMNGRISGGR
jgi:DNA repair protein RadD